MYFHFGSWRYEPQSGALKSTEKEERLPPRLAKLFLSLLKDAGQVKEKEYLIAQVWGERIVNDDALARGIAELRQILGDNAQSPEYIETIPRRGYRFLPKVTTSETTTSPGSKKPGLILTAAIVTLLTLSAFFWHVFQTDTSEPGVSLPDSAGHFWQQAIVNAQRATASDSLEYHPEISPSGQFLAFTERSRGVMLVRIQDSNGQTLHTIAEPESWVLSPVWSPDEKQIAVAIADSTQCQVVIITLASQLREELTQCSIPNASAVLDWSPDGSHIAFVAQNENEAAGYHIYTYHLSSGVIQQLTEAEDPAEYDTRPRFSPDSNRIGFIRGTDSVRNIYIQANSDDAVPIPITQHKAFSQSFTWLKDGRSIIFDGNPKGDRNLWLWQEDNPEPINLGARDSQNPSLTRDNGQLAFQEVNYQANLQAIYPEEERIDTIVKSPKYDNHPALSPDGELLAYTSNRFGRNEIWLYDFQNGADRKLMTMEGEHLVSPFWSSDQTRLLISSFGDKGYFCYEYDLVQNAVKRVASKNVGITQCTYDQSGHVLAITRGEPAANQLVSVMSGEATERLSGIAISRARPWGEHHIIFSQADKNGLFLVDTRTGTVTDILPDFPRHRSGSWTTDQDYVYFTNVWEQNQIWRLDLNSLESEAVFESIRPAIAGNIAVAHNGQRLVASVRGNNNSNIFISTQ